MGGVRKCPESCRRLLWIRLIWHIGSELNGLERPCTATGIKQICIIVLSYFGYHKESCLNITLSIQIRMDWWWDFWMLNWLVNLLLNLLLYILKNCQVEIIPSIFSADIALVFKKMIFPLFTSREAAWSCRTVGQKRKKRVTYGFWLIVASLFVLFLTSLQIMTFFLKF